MPTKMTRYIERGQLPTSLREHIQADGDPSKTERNFRIDTLRRRMNYLIERLSKDDSVSARRFSEMEISALQCAIDSMERDKGYQPISNSLILLLEAIETGTDDELSTAVEGAHKIVDRYGL